MNEKDLKSLKTVRMSKAAKARIAARLDGECPKRSTHPAEKPFAEPETCHAEKSGGWDWLHGVGTAVAACLVVAVSAGMILAVQRHQPPLAPGNVVEQQAACRVPMYTPFGDILEADLLFQYPTDYTQKAAQDMQDKGISDVQMMEERTLQTELKQSLAEVFRVYGWREQENLTAPEATVTDDCIVMHIYRMPERNSDDVTAYFQFDGDGQHFVRVDADGETKWYDLDEEIIRCLRSIIIEQTAAEYHPAERGFADVMSRINDACDDAGNPFNLTDGQEAALSTLLNRSVLYAWNTLREPDPRHGRYIRLQLMEPTKAGKPQTYGTMTFWLDTGCLTYEISETYHGSGDDADVSGSVHSYQDYWVDDGAFMEAAEQLLRDGMYPGCPVGDLMDTELSADPEPSGLNQDTWKGQLSAYLNSLTWLEIPCPVDGREQYKQLELVYVRDDKKYALTFYPEMNFMEWTEEHEKYTFVSEDNTQSHIVSHYFAMPPEVWENVKAIMQNPTSENDLPFRELLEKNTLYHWNQELTDTQKQNLLRVLDQVDTSDPTEETGEVSIKDEHTISIGIGEPCGVESSENAKGFLYFCKESQTLACSLKSASGTFQATRYPLDEDLYRAVSSAVSNQPFMNLLLSSYMPECTVTNTWESGKRFGVTLPDEGVRFTFDTFKMQELFETFDWTPVNVPVQNWTPGYVTMHLGMRSELRFGTTPNDSYGHYLIRYQNGNNEASVYYADEDFMKQFMQLLSSSQDHPHSDDADSDNKMLISIASDYLRNNVPSVIDTILWDGTEVTQINKLPENYVPVAMLEWKYGSELTGDFWLVRFHTTQDALLGTEDVYLTEDGIVIGLGIRE